MWTWNQHVKPHHCFGSSSTKWVDTLNDHCISGCKIGAVSGCPPAPRPTPAAPTPPPSPAPALSWIFKTNQSLGYSHMAMIEKIDDTTLVAAFQAAKVHEGLFDQDIYFTQSLDKGKTWAPVRGRIAVNGHGSYAVWGPVLHWDAHAKRLLLFFAQSGAFNIRSKGRSGVGGDLMVTESADRGATWSKPRLILPFAIQNVTTPKITANKLIEITAGPAKGAWVLPFWQTPSNYYYASGGSGEGGNGISGSRSSSNATAGTEGPQAAGVLISRDRGSTWAATMLYGSPTKVIENTLAQAANGSLVMLFRTGAGELYRSYSLDGTGAAWTVPAASGVPNPNAK